MVASIPDVAPADEDNSDVHVPPSSSSVPAIVPERVVSATTPRPRGRYVGFGRQRNLVELLILYRPRKKPAEGDEVPKIPKKRGRKPKAAVAAALAAQPTMTASSEHDSSDSSDVSYRILNCGIPEFLFRRMKLSLQTTLKCQRFPLHNTHTLQPAHHPD